jgi:hypothetical protein
MTTCGQATHHNASSNCVTCGRRTKPLQPPASNNKLLPMHELNPNQGQPSMCAGNKTVNPTSCSTSSTGCSRYCCGTVFSFGWRLWLSRPHCFKILNRLAHLCSAETTQRQQHSINNRRRKILDVCWCHKYHVPNNIACLKVAANLDGSVWHRIVAPA